MSVFKDGGRIPSLLPIGVSGFFLVWMYGFLPYASGYGLKPTPLFGLAWNIWISSDQWSHGMLVFPLAAGLLWVRRKDLADIPLRGSNWGLPFIVLGSLIFWGGYVANLQYFGYLALQLLLAGLVLWFAGPAFFREIFFIWFLLLFAYPFGFLDELVAFPLRILMSRCAYHLLNGMNVEAVREGTAVLSAPDVGKGLPKGARFAVDVADPCSGMRSLYALWMVACVWGTLIYKRGWKIMLIVLVALPLALVGNLVRIIILTFGTLWFGAGFAIGTLEHPTPFHTGAGFAVYLIALAGLIGLTYLLRRIRSSRTEKGKWSAWP